MSKILCIDFGTKRIGLSIPIRSIAFGLETLETVDYNHLIATIDKYIKNKYIDTLVIGHPLKSDKSLFPIEKDIIKFINFFKTKYPKLIIKRIDERFSSKIANYFLINSFFNKKKRKQKKILDQISAILLLQDFISNNS
ncbi:Holliday junction resolvase-like protein [Candidatus Sulcia muelleri SMDSEM]|uniref:Putative pre-16S rRNA nuclease n=1 Tax=Karelsulcia muelleri (strain SMDSEM) TaxID=595499 RepID=C7LK54_KARMS|nr:Holliday junction resolvase-like protein [Candidatus Karelsulcia muelleri SMDSEM]